MATDKRKEAVHRFLQSINGTPEFDGVCNKCWAESIPEPTLEKSTDLLGYVPHFDEFCAKEMKKEREEAPFHITYADPGTANMISRGLACKGMADTLCAYCRIRFQDARIRLSGPVTTGEQGKSSEESLYDVCMYCVCLLPAAEDSVGAAVLPQKCFPCNGQTTALFYDHNRSLCCLGCFKKGIEASRDEVYINKLEVARYLIGRVDGFDRLSEKWKVLVSTGNEMLREVHARKWAPEPKPETDEDSESPR